MPGAEELLKRLAMQREMEAMGQGAPAPAPMGTEPPQFFSDADNAGLGTAPMAPGGTIAGDPRMAGNPAMQIAIALQRAKQMAPQGQ